MQKFTELWENFLAGGSRHFSTPTELKLNRVLNLLLAMSYLLNFYLICIEILFAILLLTADFERYKSYVIPFAAANLAYFTFSSIAIYLKNSRGKLGVLFPLTIAHTAYLVLLSAFLGESVGIHLILFSILPVIFLIYDYGHHKAVLIHLLILIAGIVLAFLLYAYTQPLYPIPAHLAKWGHYLTWAAAISFIAIGSLYNWKQVGLTEKLLASKQEQAETLLGETIPKLASAEAKYRHLVDDAADLIFQMSASGEILSMNRAIKKLLGYQPEEVVGRPLDTLVADGLEGDPELNRTILREQLSALSADAPITSFRSTLAKKHSSDPIDVEIRLQLIPLATGSEIIGKIWAASKDIVREFLEKEKSRYVISNNLTHADMLSQRICDQLQKFLPASEIGSIRICLREILINAIEHGNLEIDFDEKTRAMLAGNYLDFLRSRMKRAEYRDKKVYVDFVVDGNQLAVRITDEGQGFDFQEYLRKSGDASAMEGLEHGRGITMTQSVFDKVVYSGKGNQVTLWRRLNTQNT